MHEFQVNLKTWAPSAILYILPKLNFKSQEISLAHNVFSVNQSF